MNKARRVVENMEIENVSVICSELGMIAENATPLKQAKYINEILNTAENMNICMVETMRKCGGCCLSANLIEQAKKLHNNANNITEFLDSLNEKHIGGGNLHISEGKIIGIYKECYCNIPKQIEKINKGYCECSAGWYTKLFSEVFEKKVTVKILDTIVNGAMECRFEISDYE
ncbi:MAG: DUF6144 family protein [Lachnospiraceae bacterium]|nr:DUF6144 family protein [Lachnospiraceae bacterium]